MAILKVRQLSLFRFPVSRKTTIMSSLPHYIHHLTGGDPPVVQEPLGWERSGGLTVTEFRGSYGMEEGKGERYLASGHQYGNALLGVRHQEEEVSSHPYPYHRIWIYKVPKSKIESEADTSKLFVPTYCTVGCNLPSYSNRHLEGLWNSKFVQARCHSHRPTNSNQSSGATEKSNIINILQTHQNKSTVKKSDTLNLMQYVRR